MRSSKVHRGHGFNRLYRRCDVLLVILLSINIVWFVFIRRPPCDRVLREERDTLSRSTSKGQLRGPQKPLVYESIDTQEKVRFRPARPRVVAAREWDVNKVRCAFVTLLREADDVSSYAGFLESTTRLRKSFKLESEYPHYGLYQGEFPRVHQTTLRLTAPWLRFYNISKVWGNDNQRPPPEFWNATDRSEGYKHMCRFFGRQLFYIASKELNLDIVMRVDDDVFLLRQVQYDPFQLIWQSGAVYGWGGMTRENHFHTELTFQPWIRDYCQHLKEQAITDDIDDDADQTDFYRQEPPLSIFTSGLGRRLLSTISASEKRHSLHKIGDCAQIAQSVIEQMYFNNVFITTIDFWHSSQVMQYADDIDSSHGIYVHRWGDAPMQTAALRLFAPENSVRRLPDLHYVHFSTDNLILDGKVTCLNCEGSHGYFAKLSSFVRDHYNNYHQLGKSVVSIDEIVHKGMQVHRTTFIEDLLNTGIWRDWGSGATLDNLPTFAFLQLIEKVGVWCDNVGFINVHILLPQHCCCHLDTYRPDNEAAQTATATMIYKILEPWMHSAFVRTWGGGGRPSFTSIDSAQEKSQNEAGSAPRIFSNNKLVRTALSGFAAASATSSSSPP